MGRYGRAAATSMLVASLLFSAVEPVRAADILQCVPYARVVSGVDITGDAWTWWDQAEGRYDRGRKPKKGAVLAFQPWGVMNRGHVAVVSKIVSKREVLIRHANWSSPGLIEEDVLAIDVSPDGDWSEVRVWHSPTGKMGVRVNPTFGFIYPEKPRLHAFRPTGENALWTETQPPEQKPAPQARRTETVRASRPAPTRSSHPGRQDGFIIEYAEAQPPNTRERSLEDIIRDVKKGANIR